MKTKINTKKLILNIVLYGSFILLSATALDYGIIKTTLFVLDPLPQWTPATVNVPHRAPKSAPEAKIEATGTIREVSAYNSVSGQTDSSPCIGADGTDLCQRHEKGECIVASNAYPLGSKVTVEKIGICTVADRMNRRYQNRVDIFMNKDIKRAINFGVQRLKVAEI